MDAIILTAGKGSRLQPVTNYLPKPMIDFWGMPFIEYTIRNLSETDEIDKIYLVVNYKKELIVDHFGSEYNGTPIEYLVQNSSTGGTADAISYAKDSIKDDFIVILGDVYLSNDHLKQLINNKGTVLSATKIGDPQNHKIIEHDREGNLITFSNNGNWADLGFWRLTPDIFKFIEKTRPEFDRAEEVKMLPVIEKCKKKLNPIINRNQEPWIQIGDHMEVEGVIIAKDYLGKKYYQKEEGESSVQVKTTNSQIDNSIIFGPGRLKNSKISNSLVYLCQDNDNLDLNREIWAR